MSTLTRKLAELLIAVLLAVGCRGGRIGAGPGHYTIGVGPAVALVEVAADSASRARGLSGRHELGENEGMLFIFPRAERVAFWMKDTYIPLSIAFIAPGGQIAEIRDMEPMTTTYHKSAEPVIMALEMSAGWFAKNGVGVGDLVVLPRELEAIEAR